MIRLQAENGGRTGIWFVKETRDGKRQYIETTEDNAGLTYNITLPAAGNYYLWINGGVRRNTSVYTVRFDARTIAGDLSQYDDQAREGQFRWRRVSIPEVVRKGMHTLALQNAEPKTVSFDRIIITNDVRFIPEGSVKTGGSEKRTSEGDEPDFTDEELAYARNVYQAEVQFKMVNKFGLEIPYINGRGIWGIHGHAGIVPIQGINCFHGRPLDVSLIRKYAKQGVAYDAIVWMGPGALQHILGDDFKKMHIPGDMHRYKSAKVGGKETTWAFGKGPTRYGVNIFNSGAVDVVCAAAKKLVSQYKDEPVIMYGMPSGENSFPGYGSYDEYSRRDWQAFCQQLFGDQTPNIDTNGDGATYNSAYAKEFSSWQEVDRFTTDDFDKNPRTLVLNNLWKCTGQPRYFESIAAAMHEVKPGLISWPGIGTEMLDFPRGVDMSLSLASSEVKVVRVDSYGVEEALLMAAFTHPFRKAILNVETAVQSKNDYVGMKDLAVSALPYIQGFIWIGYRTPSKDENDFWSQVALIRERGHGGVIKRYDSRFRLIPRLAPFIGHIYQPPDDEILWLNSAIDDQWPMQALPLPTRMIFNAHAASDILLMLKPEYLNLDRYKVIIYRSEAASCISRDIYERLRDYVRKGGVVVVNAYVIARHNTLRGLDNKQDWWRELKLRRGEADTIKLYRGWPEQVVSASPSYRYHVTHRALAKKRGYADAQWTDYSWFVHKFELPESVDGIKISDVHTAWGAQIEIRMWTSPDGEEWTLRYDEPEKYQHIKYQGILDIEKDLGGQRTLFVKYELDARHGNSGFGDIRGDFRVDGVKGQVFDPTGTTSVLYDHKRCEYASRYPCLEPADASITTEGEVVDSTGETYPLLMIRKEGKGKWLLVNLPEIFKAYEPFKLDKTDWEKRFGLLSDIVRTHSGKTLPDYMDIHSTKGEGFIVGWRPSDVKGRTTLIKVTSDYPKTVVFEIFDKKTVDGKPCLESRHGYLEFQADFTSAASHLWVTKPYGQPIVLYTDGTLRNQGRIDDGEFKQNELRFAFTNEAYVSSPKRPERAIVDGNEISFSYDETSHLVMLKHSGTLGALSQARLVFEP